MNDKVFFSVIIPSYNRAKIIADTIQSVIEQDFKDFEIILVDDGSKDNTKEVVTQIQDQRLHYFYQENKERSAARNTGIRQAKAEYICFLDSDDRYEPNHLSTLYNFIKDQKDKKALYFCDHYYIENAIRKEAPVPAIEDKNPAFYFLFNPVVPARVCVHHEILKTIKFDERIVIVEDTVLWVHISLHFPVHHIRKRTVLYLLHDENSVNINYNAFATRLHGLNIFFKDKEIKNAIPAHIKRNLIGNCHLGIARHFEYKRKFFSMLLHLILSFLYAPLHPQNKAKLYMVYRYIFLKK